MNRGIGNRWRDAVMGIAVGITVICLSIYGVISLGNAALNALKGVWG